MRKDTISVHAGRRAESVGIVNAVEPSSAFRYIDEEAQPYPRYFNTPNQRIVVDQICGLEQAPAGILFASGMAAISTTLCSVLRRGDHIILQDALYGGTHSFVLKEFERAGISYTFTSCDVRAVVDAMKPSTKVIYVETPSNPLLDIVDLRSLAKEAKSASIVTVVDNTFASPINQNPIELGIDVVLHSGTKYLGGHSDLSFGVVVSSEAIIQRVQERAVLFGGSVNALTCYLIERSIKTLAIRVQRQNQNAQQLAAFLEAHSKIDQVFYPGLASHPGHAIALVQMSGFGGMLSFNLGKGVSAKNFLQALELISPAMSLGGVESSTTIPVYTSHKAMPARDRAKLGITEQLVRLSVGIESSVDLIHDLEQALNA